MTKRTKYNTKIEISVRLHIHCESKNWTLLHLRITLANTVRF